MEKTRKLSLKRKRPLGSGKKQVDVNKKSLVNPLQDGEKPHKKKSSVPESRPNLKQTAQIIFDPSTWQHMPSLPQWTAFEEMKEDPSVIKESSVEIQVTEDVKIQWTPLPPFCKHCLIRRIPRGTHKPESREQAICKTKQDLNAAPSKVGGDITCSKSKSAENVGPNDDDQIDPSKAKPVPKTGFSKPGAVRSSESDKTKSLVSLLGRDRDRDLMVPKYSPAPSKSALPSRGATKHSESSGSENEQSTTLESGSRNRTAGKKFVPFSASRTAKPTNASLSTKPDPASRSSSFRPCTSKQMTVVHAVGSSKSSPSSNGASNSKQSAIPHQESTPQVLSNKHTRVSSDAQISNSNIQNVSVPKEASSSISDDDPLGGLTDEDLIVILSSDDEDDQAPSKVFEMPKPAAPSNTTWKPSKNVGSKSSRTSSLEQKSVQKGRTKQSKASGSSSQKSKAASKAPTRTMFDYAKTIPSSNQRGTSKSGVQCSNQRALKQQSAVRSGKSSHDQSTSGNRTQDKPGEESSLQSCPLCQLTFKAGWSQLQIDGHIAACLAESSDDVMW